LPPDAGNGGRAPAFERARAAALADPVLDAD